MIFSQTRCIFANASVSFVQLIACNLNLKKLTGKCNLEQLTVLFVVAVVLFFLYYCLLKTVFIQKFDSQ